MRIMGYFRDDYHIDEDLFEIFVKEKIYKKYADKYVKSNQIDTFDHYFCINFDSCVSLFSKKLYNL